MTFYPGRTRSPGSRPPPQELTLNGRLRKCAPWAPQTSSESSGQQQTLPSRVSFQADQHQHKNMWSANQISRLSVCSSGLPLVRAPIGSSACPSAPRVFRLSVDASVLPLVRPPSASTHQVIRSSVAGGAGGMGKALK